MMNMNFVKEAAELAYKTALANYMTETYAYIQSKAASWYDELDLDSRKPQSVEILAAMALYGEHPQNKHSHLTWGDIQLIHDYWFPKVPDRYTEDHCTYMHC